MKRRIMREFRIDEISAVDVPAQEHATATIIKAAMRRDERFVMNSLTEPSSFEEAVLSLRRSDRTLKAAPALQIARREYPALFERYQREALSIHERSVVKRNATPVVKAEQLRFQMLVDSYVCKNKVTRTEAMRAVRVSHPKEYTELQNSCL